jgi:hypothetical protein
MSSKLLSTPKHGNTAASKEGTVKWNAKKGHYITSKGKALTPHNNNNQNNQLLMNEKMARELQKQFNKQPKSLNKTAKKLNRTVAVSINSAAAGINSRGHSIKRNRSVKASNNNEMSKTVAKMTVVELKETLTARGLSTKGLKADLVKRLLNAIKNNH